MSLPGPERPYRKARGRVNFQTVWTELRWNESGAVRRARWTESSSRRGYRSPPASQSSNLCGRRSGKHHLILAWKQSSGRLPYGGMLVEWSIIPLTGETITAILLLWNRCHSWETYEKRSGIAWPVRRHIILYDNASPHKASITVGK